MTCNKPACYGDSLQAIVSLSKYLLVAEIQMHFDKSAR